MPETQNNTLTFARPLTTVDVVIFTLLSHRLHVLLVQRPNVPSEPFPGSWALPGGFVDVELDDSLLECARRKLREKTGVDATHLEQVGSWGDANRDPRGWSATHVYLALMPADRIQLTAGGNTADIKWQPVPGDLTELQLAFDHAELLLAALDRLRSKTEYTSLPAFLLPRTFTLGELQQVYEEVLGRPLERKAFRTRMLGTDLLEAQDELKVTGRRPAQLYALRPGAGPVYFVRAFETPRVS